jgi:TRAP-type C4-dicarboxylate transport system permease small subunit
VTEKEVQQGLAQRDPIERALDRASYALAIVGGAAVILMMLQISADVAMKYAWNRTIVGTIEIISAYYMPAVIFLPLAAVEHGRRHIIVSLFTQRLGPRAVSAFDAFACLVGVVYTACLTWSGGAIAVLQTARLETLDVTFYDLPVWPTRWFLPLGSGLLMLYMLLHLVRDVRRALGKPRGPSERDKLSDVEQAQHNE